MGLFDTAAREAFREQGGVSGLNGLGRERSQPQVADQREQATHAQRVRAVGGPANAGPDAILQPLGYILLNPLAGTRENFFFQAEDGIRDLTVTSSDVCSSD